MLILAMDTATQAGSIALLDAPPGEQNPPRILGEHTLNVGTTHSERLMPAIDQLLAATSLGIQQVQGIALAIGPGSFTGLRIGVSAVKGLAFALGVPVVGVPTLDALAQNLKYGQGLICPVIDARKKEVYAALFRGDGRGHLTKESDDWVLAPEDLCSRIPERVIFLGNGIEVYGGILRERLASRALFTPPELSLPRAVHVGCLSIPQFQKGQTVDLFSFTPVYIRRSEAEIMKNPKIKNQNPK
jgi:tRNA threonylcarbamoyladenosine biosynthesis protein TsaB